MPTLHRLATAALLAAWAAAPVLALPAPAAPPARPTPATPPATGAPGATDAPRAPDSGTPGAPASGTPAPGASAPPGAPAAPAQPAAPAPHATVGALLDAAEAIAATLTDFRAGVQLETTDDVTEDTERRSGQVVLAQSAGKPETRRFAVVFTAFIDSSGRMDERPVRYIYADGWITEADFTQRTLLRRQLARPGEAYDPLKPGEGPVPLPIGQRKAEVERRFDASLAGTPAAPAIAAMRDIQGVVLIPKPGMADRDLVRATVWYDLRTMAPVGVEAERRNGRTTVVLRAPALNAGLTDEHRALLTLAGGQTEGWRVDERPLPPQEP